MTTLIPKYDQGATGAINRAINLKLAEEVSIKDFGAIGDGTTDDTAAINAALAASSNVIVPVGMTCLISSTIAVTNETRLFFQGGTGNAPTQTPLTYFIKKSTMTTPAITIDGKCIVEGGGVVCQAGNTGDGVQLIGNNAKLSYFYVKGAGGNGVRVGTTAGANVNSFELNHVNSFSNTGDGFYIHHGNAATNPDTNSGTLYSCIATNNTASGFNLGYCWWVQIINGLAETNGAWGLYLSGTANSTYPECRWATILGGDYNEGNNTGGAAGQIADYSYFSNFIQPDFNNVPTNAGNGLQGSGIRNVLCGRGGSVFSGLTISNYPFISQQNHSLSGTSALATGVAKTLFAVTQGLSIVTTNVFGSGAVWQSTYLVNCDGTTATIVALQTATNVALTLSGLNVQATSTAPITIGYTTFIIA